MGEAVSGEREARGWVGERLWLLSCFGEYDFADADGLRLVVGEVD